MPSHPIDYEINPNVFTTPELSKIFDEKTRYQRWLDFEAALAAAQAELDVIPQDAAEEIQKKARVESLDLDFIREGYSRSGNSLIPLINGLRKACDHGHGEFVHYGTTTQDVLDTAQTLEIKAVVNLLYRDLRPLEDQCLALARRHRETPIIARTHGQQALPTTFGLKAAVWSGEIRRHIQRIKSISPRIIVGQLSGAVGTMAALGPHAPEIAKRTMDRLELRHEVLPWHNSRDNIAELASIFSLMTITLAKIANEIFQLQKREIDELREPAPVKASASSTMPHKRNPVICQRIVALSKHVRYLSATVVESMAHEHERDARCLWSEWLAVPQLCIYTGTTLTYMLKIVSGLEVRTEQMMANLSMHKAAVCSEWLLFRLRDRLGKSKAQDKARSLLQKAGGNEGSLEDIVMNDPEMAEGLTPQDLSYLDHPEQYIGHAVEMVDAAIAEIERQRARDPEKLFE